MFDSYSPIAYSWRPQLSRRWLCRLPAVLSSPRSEWLLSFEAVKPPIAAPARRTIRFRSNWERMWKVSTRKSCTSLLYCLLGFLGMATPAWGDPVQLVFTTAQSPFTPGALNQGCIAKTFLTSNPISTTTTSSSITVSKSFETSSRSISAVSQRPCRTASLEVIRHDGGNLIYDLFDVTTDQATLNNNDRFMTDVFEDIGTGLLFGSFSIGTGSTTDVLRLPFNSAGVAAISAARGGFFSLGGAVNGRGLISSATAKKQSASSGWFLTESHRRQYEPMSMLLVETGLWRIGARQWRQKRAAKSN